MTWYKKVLTENKKEIITSAIISLVITLAFSVWYFRTGKGFEWRTISLVSQPNWLGREFYSLLAFATIGAFLYYVVRLWQILKFICKDILGSWSLYNGVKKIVWAILILITRFYLVPTVVIWLNAVISFFYNIAILFLYLMPLVGIFLLVFLSGYGVSAFAKRKSV